MTNDVYKKLIDNLPQFLAEQFATENAGVGIFKPIKNVLDLDEGYVFFLNPDSIQLKYAFGQNQQLKAEETFTLTKNLKGDLFFTENALLDKDNELINSLKLPYNKSFLVIKLVIKNSVYGFLLLCKKEDKYYTQSHLEISKAIGTLISYKIKDLELSDIFKNQLKSLKEGFVETKAAYKTIKEQNIKILEADNVKNEFLANISHELRTPLNAIIGFSEILSAKLYGDLNEKQTEYVKEISISAIHLNGMIDEILDISKLESKAMKLNRSEFFISQAVDEVVNVVMPLISKKNITISKNIEAILVFADFQKMRQILFNLLSNAIKFTKENGKIEIKTNKNNKNFIIKVTDNGIGIEEKDQARIFEKFVQLETTYTKKESSTGLGLTITKELVEMHNGTIKVESKLGKGTSFIIEIPIKSKN